VTVSKAAILAAPNVGPKPVESKEQQEAAKLQGTWSAVAVEYDGADKSDELKVLGWLLTFTGERARLKGASRIPNQPLVFQDDEGIFSLDAGATPKRFRIVSPSTDPSKVNQLLGIYAFEQARLKLCYEINPTPVEYPASFTTK